MHLDRTFLLCLAALLAAPLTGCPSGDDDDSADDDDSVADDDDAADDDDSVVDDDDSVNKNDVDGDGFEADVDCDDNNAAIHPDQAESCWNGVDDNCDGIADQAQGGSWYYRSNGDKQSFGTTANSWTLNSDFTVELWVRRFGPPGQEVRILRTMGGGQTSDARLVVDLFTDNRVELEVVGSGNTGGHGYTTANAALHDGFWHHVAFVFTRSTNTGIAYIDGTPSATWTPSSSFATQPLEILSLVQLGENSPMDQDADFDDVRIWAVGRTADEVATDACNPIAAETTGLLANLTFEAAFETPDDGPFGLVWTSAGQKALVYASRQPHIW